jgi:hypothetical protein
MPLTLTPAQLSFYRENGYLLLHATEHQILPDPSVLPRWSDEVRNWPLSESKGTWMPYFEETETGVRQVMRTEKFMDYHEGLKALLCSEDLGGILAQLSGDVSSSFSI